MRRVGEDFPPPAFSVEYAMHETVANAGGDVGLLIMDYTEVIASHAEAAPIKLADPALYRNLPVGVAEEEAADDADADRLAGRGGGVGGGKEEAAAEAGGDRRAGGGGGRRGRGRKMTRDNAGNHLAIDLLQLAVVAALIGEQKWLLGAHGLDEIALQESRIDVFTQCAQLLLISRAPARDLTFVGVDDRQFGDTGGKARFGMTRPQRQRQRAVVAGERLVDTVERFQHVAAIVVGLEIFRM